MTENANAAADETMLERAKTFQRIKTRLRDQLGKRWPVGTQLPPIPELAKQIKSGHTNTYRAVKELVKDGLLTSRTGRGTFVTSRAAPSRASAASAILTSNRPRVKPAVAHAGVEVCILMPTTEPDLFCKRATDAFVDVIRTDGCRISNGVYQSKDPAPLAQFDAPRALLVINPGARQLLQARPDQLLVVINTAPETAIGMETGYDVVSADDTQGGLIAAKHLVAAGCTSVCFMGVGLTHGSDLYDVTSGARLNGFKLAWPSTLPPPVEVTCKEYRTLSAASALPKFLKLDPRPQAVFAASDDIGVGFIHGALAHGLEAGRDYHIIGYDAQDRGRHLPNGGSLTSIEVPMAEMGRLAGELLLARLTQPDRRPTRVALGCGLFQGTTTRTPAAVVDAAAQ